MVFCGMKYTPLVTREGGNTPLILPTDWIGAREELAHEIGRECQRRTFAIERHGSDADIEHIESLHDKATRTLVALKEPAQPALGMDAFSVEVLGTVFRIIRAE